VGLYLQQHGGKADANALYVLEGGGNDILNTTTGSPDALAYQIASGIVASEVALRQAGARHFVIPNLFHVGILPATVALNNVTFANAASEATNKWERKLLANEESLPGVQIIHMDIFSLFNAVETDPTHFGFADVTNPCVTATSLCSDPDHRLFWDDHHPTLFGQTFFAVTFENAISSQSE